MARLPDQRKILPEDFPEQKWIPALLSPLNRFFEDVVRALNKGLTFKENIAGEILTVTIDGVFPLDVRWTNMSPPIAAWIGKCRETSGNHTNFTDPLFLDWELTASGQFRINNITGLTATMANKFSVTIIAITG
jgi:hypothetical protein